MIERFYSKVIVGQPDECWLWTAGRSANGYGTFWVNGRTRSAHRVAYELEHGEVEAGKTIDHLCMNKVCVNVAHLEAVTHDINVQRYHASRTTCFHGHVYNGSGRCRECQRAASQRFNRKRAARKRLVKFP